jgi:hypothetical protein
MKPMACLGLLAILLLGGCRRRGGEAEAKDFARLYVRLRVASSSREGRPERARQAREDVLRAAGTDLEGYRSDLRHLQDDPDRWEAFWTEVQRLSDSISNPQRKGH